MNESKLQANIDALREFVHSKGWSIADEKEIHSGYHLTVTDGIAGIPVAFFCSGKALIQGKAGALQTELKSWWDTRKTSYTQSSVPATIQSSFVETSPGESATNFSGVARIGLDESGKGDYFGTHVIAAVFVYEQTDPQLNALRTRDSNLLTDSRMLLMAEEIKTLCPNLVVPIEPKRYNELYNR